MACVLLRVPVTSVAAEGPRVTGGFTGRIVSFRRVLAHCYNLNLVAFVELLRELYFHIHILANLHDALPNVHTDPTSRARPRGILSSEGASLFCELARRQWPVCVEPRARLQTTPMPPTKAGPRPRPYCLSPLHTKSFRRPNPVPISTIRYFDGSQAGLTLGRASWLFGKVRACSWFAYEES